jgi:uncharacterized membrane protein YccC
MDKVAGTVIPPFVATVMEAVALAMFGVVVLAVTIAEPLLFPVTVTVAVVVFAAIVTLAGTVATVVLDEVRFTTTGEVVALDSVRVKF